MLCFVLPTFSKTHTDRVKPVETGPSPPEHVATCPRAVSTYAAAGQSPRRAGPAAAGVAPPVGGFAPAARATILRWPGVGIVCAPRPCPR